MDTHRLMLGAELILWNGKRFDEAEADGRRKGVIGADISWGPGCGGRSGSLTGGS